MRTHNDLGLAVNLDKIADERQRTLARFPYTVMTAAMAVCFGMQPEPVINMLKVASETDAAAILHAARYFHDHPREVPGEISMMWKAAMYVKRDFAQDPLVLTRMDIDEYSVEFYFKRSDSTDAAPKTLTEPRWLSYAPTDIWRPPPHGVAVKFYDNGILSVHPFDQQYSMYHTLRVLTNHEIAPYLTKLLTSILKVQPLQEKSSKAATVGKKGKRK